MHQKIADFQKTAIWRGFYSVNGALISLAGVCLTLVVFATVVARYVFKQDIYGGEEIILLFAWWLYFLGGIGGSQEDSQIKADMIDILCSNKTIVDVCKGIAKALESIVFLICLYLTILLLQVNFVKMPVTTGLKIPYVCSQIPIAIGFLFMALFAIYWAVFFITKAVEHVPNPVDPVNDIPEEKEDTAE